MKTLWAAVIAIVLAAATGGANAQGYPNKPIRIIVPFAAGGAVDTLARLIGSKLSEQLGQPVVVENRAGAGGNLAPDALSKAAPDGYTILLTTNGLAISPSLYRTLPFDVYKDFVAVTQVVASQLVIAATPKLSANSIAELIALAKAKPGGLNYGSTGIGNPLHLTMEMLKSTAGIDIQAVPYRGDAPLNAALIAGEIQVAVVPMATVLPHLESGMIKALAIGGAQRAPALPNVPTVAETIPGFESDELAGVVRARRHAARHRADDPARNRQGAQAAGRGRSPEDRRQRGRGQHAGGVRRPLPRRHRRSSPRSSRTRIFRPRIERVEPCGGQKSADGMPHNDANFGIKIPAAIANKVRKDHNFRASGPESQQRRRPMSIEGLGYVGVRAKSLEDWSNFGTRFLGMQLVDKSAKSLALRMDDRKQRVVVSEDGGEGVGFFGWEVPNAAALDAMGARLEKAGVQVARGSRALAHERRVKDLIVFTDPLGNRLEIFHGAETASDPFKPGRSISGFRTGPLGMGHAVLHVKNINDAVPFYRDVLGFKLSDYMLRPFNAYFFHANPRHHSIAFIETGRSATHHLMVELFSLDDVGQCYDLALTEPDKLIGVTLGRHINDEVTSFYSNSPSNFMFEYGWGGRVIDVDNWKEEEVTWGPSMWGHDRMWLPPETRVDARNLRIKAASTGLRKPVNVLEGNYHRMPGVCPWWDGMLRDEAAE